LLKYLQRWGRPVTYSYVRGTWPIEMYQNVYATVPGSAEMPSAGRPFTQEILDRLLRTGVRVASIVLHTGVASLERDEPPYEEYFEVPHETAAAVRQTRQDGGRVIAIGTTVVRALESAADSRGRAIAARGWTDLVVTRERGVGLVDGLLTGFHEPKATHLALLETIAGRPHLERAYRAALEAGYLWHEFGDVHLLLPDRVPAGPPHPMGLGRTLFCGELCVL
jgi:S-adenosylmethionine:tRNA ribosyltransferase-isomerase